MRVTFGLAFALAFGLALGFALAFSLGLVLGFVLGVVLGFAAAFGAAFAFGFVVTLGFVLGFRPVFAVEVVSFCFPDLGFGVFSFGVKCVHLIRRVQKLNRIGINKSYPDLFILDFR